MAVITPSNIYSKRLDPGNSIFIKNEQCCFVLIQYYLYCSSHNFRTILQEYKISSIMALLIWKRQELLDGRNNRKWNNLFTCECRQTVFATNLIYIREGNGTPLQYSCLENPMDGGAWKAAVHGVAEGQIRLSVFTFTCMHWRRKWQPTSVFLPGESQGWESLVGCRLWGHTESDTTEVTQQQQQLIYILHSNSSVSCT